MLVLALLGLATTTSVVPARIVITIAAGRCQIKVDGRPQTPMQFERAARAWGDRDIHFQPSPRASYGCVNRTLEALKRSRAPMKFGFIGNEQYDPAERGR